MTTIFPFASEILGWRSTRKRNEKKKKVFNVTLFIYFYESKASHVFDFLANISDSFNFQGHLKFPPAVYLETSTKHHVAVKHAFK